MEREKVWTCVALLDDASSSEIGFKIKGSPTDGVEVHHVDPNGWAATQGVQPRDEVIAVNDIDIAEYTKHDFQTALMERPLALTLRRTSDAVHSSFAYPLPPIGSTVCVQSGPSRLIGTVRYTGPCDFAEGNVVGIELNAPQGSNDGKVRQRRYFNAMPSHGLFSAPESLKVLKVPEQKGYDEERKEKLNDCYGGAFPHKNADVLVRVGEEQVRGRVRFVGKTHFSPNLVVGVELKAPRGNCDGSVQSRRYFQCRPSYGFFCSTSNLQVVTKTIIEQGLPLSTVGKEPLEKKLAAERTLNTAIFVGDVMALGSAIEQAEENDVAQAFVWKARKQADRLVDIGRHLESSSGGVATTSSDLDVSARTKFALESADVLYSSGDEL